jgi:hypothetical protein
MVSSQLSGTTAEIFCATLDMHARQGSKLQTLGTYMNIARTHDVQQIFSNIYCVIPSIVTECANHG